ncbi:MAG: gliding motility-associated C-terminal domain-containing protein [Flavobacteriales bacterium]|nr:gliding motility-associated C-terminal domain-containing protein [Flavobacteriales bacterium]
MKSLVFLIAVILGATSFAQWSDCSNNIPACSNPSFNVTPNGSGNDIDFTTSSTVSNPQTNPNSSPGNSGCLLSGELNSTWIVISVSQGGDLEFSMGTAGSNNCFDWIMWPYDANTCSGIQGNTLPPEACNWNGMCGGITGMAAPGNLPAGADQSDFEYPISVNTGDQFIVCFSNYSSASTNVPLDFFGSAQVTCGSTTNPTICFGETGEIVVFDGVSWSWSSSTPGFVGTNTAGNIAYVNPTVTTDYTVTITYTDGSTTTATGTVTVLPEITASVSETPETCTGTSDGAISISLTNAVAPVTYALSGPSSSNNTTGNFSNLSAGNYTIDITDANGCTIQESATINTGPACCSMVLSVTTTNIDCFGNCNGTATVDTTGTNGPCTIQWFNNGNAIAGANGLTLSNLCAGNYSVEVTDALCTISANGSVTEPTDLVFGSTPTDLACNGDNSGQISLNVSGGTPPYQYSIDNGVGLQASSTFTGLAAGSYNLLVQDANGCQSTGNNVLIEPLALNVTTTIVNNTCNSSNGNCDGMITATVTGGSVPYNYVWSIAGTNSSISGLCAGNYSLTVVDENGCSQAFNGLSVTEPAAITINPSMITQPLCSGDCNGTISIQSSNATNYSIDNGITFSASPNFTDLCAGIYDLVAADLNGCSISGEAILWDPSPVIADFTFTPDSAVVSNPVFELTSNSTNSTNHYWFYVDTPDTVLVTDLDPILNLPTDGPGIYSTCIVAYNNNFCYDTTCHDLVVGDEFYIFVPNSFSPNNDGVNDIFYPVVNNYNENKFEFYIFNRWGELIFKSEHPDNGWNGIHISTPAEVGTYVWKIKTESEFDHVKKVIVGHVNLFR